MNADGEEEINPKEMQPRRRVLLCTTLRSIVLSLRRLYRCVNKNRLSDPRHPRNPRFHFFHGTTQKNS